jgi:N-acetylglucosaminyldiphosphoundecaprenol N-acetyl-beta-D-mannosaminyltransferase
MSSYFNVNLEFDHELFYKTIDYNISINNKGYVCVVDGNVLTTAQKDLHYREIINRSLINTCDGSSIAWLAGMIYNEKFRALSGPEIFKKYIESGYKQTLIGSNTDVIEKIKSKLRSKAIDGNNINHIPLPFLPVSDFNYLKIAEEINNDPPDIIWVSLGAPKQEIFMSKLLPHLNYGVMFGIGAAFNFYIGEITMPKKRKGALQFIWLNRIYKEPKKQLKRVIPYILILPRLIFNEIKIKNKIGN